MALEKDKRTKDGIICSVREKILGKIIFGTYWYSHEWMEETAKRQTSNPFSTASYSSEN